jgi:hypothetical protein
MFIRTNTDDVVTSKDHGRAARDSRAAEIKSDLEKPPYNDTLAAIKAIVEREPDGERAVEAVADIIMNDPLGTFFAIADAEAAEGADAGNDCEATREACPIHQALLEYAEREGMQVYSYHHPETLGPTAPFRRQFPRSFRRVHGVYWQPYDGWGKPLGGPWHFKQYDDLLLLPLDTWRYADDDTCFLYDDRGADVGYWCQLARVIEATTNPLWCRRQLIWPDGPPSTAVAKPAFAP